MKNNEFIHFFKRKPISSQRNARRFSVHTRQVRLGAMRCVGLAVTALLFASAASAQAVLYDCDVTQKKKNLDWIPDKVGIVVAENGQVTVSDPLILHFVKHPMPAKVSRNNAKKLAIRWVIEDVVNAANQQTPHFDYSANINKKNMRFSIYAKPENYPNRFSGKGSCTVRTGK